jgi:hypothetical protein
MQYLTHTPANLHAIICLALHNCDRAHQTQALVPFFNLNESGD